MSSLPAAPETSGNEPLVEASEVRIAIDGVLRIGCLSLVSQGDRVVIAGDAGALLSALTGVPRSALRAAAPDDGEPLPGEALVVAGTLELAGRSVARGAHTAIMGTAPMDPPLPVRWTVAEYVTWGARLAGLGRAAYDLANVALERVGMRRASQKKLATLTLAERRVVGLAQAIVASPEILVADAPLSGLEGDAAAFVSQALTAAADGRRTVVSVSRLDPGQPEGDIARGASYVAVLAGGEVALAGTPRAVFTGAKVYLLTVRSNTQALRHELAARGVGLSSGLHSFSAVLPPEVSSAVIVGAAETARAALVEMTPVLV